jgi:hypothetical protein
MLSAADVAAARRESDDAAFGRDRLKVAVKRLGERLKQVQAQEEDRRRWPIYNKAKAEREAIIADFTELAPSVSKLSRLVVRMEASDRATRNINASALPAGAAHLAVVMSEAPPIIAALLNELVVRDAFFSIGTAVRD